MLVLLAACGNKDGAQYAAEDSLTRDLSLAPVDSGATFQDVPSADPEPAVTPPAAVPPAAPGRRNPSPPPATPPAATPAPAPAPAPAPPAAAPTRVLGAGTSVSLVSALEFGTKSHKAGETITATVPADVTDEDGRVVIPAGAVMKLVISEMVVSENKSDSGKIVLKATEVEFGGSSYAVDGVSTRVVYSLKGRGVKAGDAAKVGAGAAAGAVVGRVLGGNKKGAVVGGVIGAAAGTAVAAESADRDIVVAQGARIVIRLSGPLEVKA